MASKESKMQSQGVFLRCIACGTHTLQVHRSLVSVMREH